MAEEPNEPVSEGPEPAQSLPAPRHQRELAHLPRRFFGPRAVSSMTLTGVFVLALIAFFYFAKAFLMPVILALLLSFVLRPAVNAFCRWGVPRGLGAAIVLVLFIGLISTALYRLNTPATDWLSKAPESLRRLESKGREFANRVDAFVRHVRGIEGNRPEQVEPNGTKAESTRLAWAEKLVSVGAILGFTAGFLAGSLETLVLLYFLLASGDLFLQKLVRLLPKMHEKREAVEIAREVEHNISGFLFTITIINCCVGLVVALVMLLLGMPNPVLWGVVAGLLNFIPYIGPLTVVLVLVLAGFLTFESTFGALLPAMIYLGIHGMESNFLTPMVLGRRLTLSPVIIFGSLMFWTWLWGMPGALLAIPLLMTFKIFCDHLKPLAPIAEFLSGDDRD
jgi:predicted PurR-regulated permease PerM